MGCLREPWSKPRCDPLPPKPGHPTLGASLQVECFCAWCLVIPESSHVCGVTQALGIEPEWKWNGEGGVATPAGLGGSQSKLLNFYPGLTKAGDPQAAGCWPLLYCG